MLVDPLYSMRRILGYAYAAYVKIEKNNMNNDLSFCKELKSAEVDRHVLCTVLQIAAGISG